MQFHLNGFRAGNPEISDPSEKTSSNSDRLPEQVDVLIVGCGPAGLTLAAQLAAFPDIKTSIVEQKSGPLLLGQADGIACRTMEMFEAFGFSERLEKEAYWVNETTFWKPDDARKEQDCPARPGAGRRGRALGVPARHPEPGARARFLLAGHAQFAEPAGAQLLAPAARRADRHRGILRRNRNRLPGDGQARADRSRARRPEGDRKGPVRGRLRRGAQRRARVPRAGAARRLGQSGLGRDGCAGRHRLPRHPPEVVHPVRERGQHRPHSARGRLSGPHLCRARQAQRERAGREPQHHLRASDRGGATHHASLYARGEGGRMVVGLRDRPAAVRQVRRRAGGGCGDAPAPRVHRRRRLPHPQPEGGAGHERLHAGRLQSGLETGGRAARAMRAEAPAHLLGRTPGRRQGADRLRSRMGEDAERAAQIIG